MIGFQKSLKKFEKVTHVCGAFALIHQLNSYSLTQIPAQKAYTIEKIEPTVFSSESSINILLQDMEELFAARFSMSQNPHMLRSCS